MRTILKLFFILLLSHKIFANILTTKSLTIASYNVENFWDALPNNTDDNWFEYTLKLSAEERKKLKRSPQYIDYSSENSNWHSPYILKAKIRSFLTVVKLLKYPDILALQEIESAGNNTIFFETPYSSGQTLKDKLIKLGYKYFILGKQNINNPVSVTTAFVSKIKLNSLQSVEITDKSNSTSARDIQAVELQLNSNERLIIFNNHWKSKRGNGNEEARIETAKKLNARILKEREGFSNSHIIVLGDLNTSYKEKPLISLNVTGDKTQMLNKSNKLLYNLWYDLPYEMRWESSYSGLRNTLSHILISDSLFRKYGLHYVDKSFKVIGQESPESDILLSSGGIPYRWQIRKRFTSAFHIGKGYSDHLPLVAKLEYTESPQINSNIKQEINYEPAPYPPLKSHLIFNEVKQCNENNSIDLLKFRHLRLESLLNKCVKLEIPKQESALPLLTRGRYRQTYIKFSLTTRQAYEKTLYIGLSMSRSYDWRPNIDDSRISEEEAAITEGVYSDSHWHPRSNKCYARKVLQGRGGSLRKIVGYIAYQNGYLTIHANSREKRNLILEDLPLSKTQACIW